MELDPERQANALENARRLRGEAAELRALLRRLKLAQRVSRRHGNRRDQKSYGDL